MTTRTLARARALATVSAGLLGGVLVLTGCGTDRSDAGAPVSDTPAAETPAPETTDAGGSAEAADADAPITLAAAKAVALASVGEGQVTGYDDEDDHGARWEIEVTRPDGSEVDVYVAADGRVVNTGERQAEQPAQAAPAPAPEPAPSGDVTLDEAKRIAVAHVGGGRVTWHERENDHGARWEIEVTRPDGSEVDVYVAADGRVVRTS
ncbi:PepSY domain-containing protein [Xylanimonas protaetiae]|uniref:PepSY domain-containing protein n=1 Tax=Xylanimonas protaetiae TaxID=2509457 RepID=A0A4P6F0X5_9MICO|nr:PepSY domain-containing protein [Xylanimonas protaetiae]QAY68856.1 hypothetical protein ET471_01330 [Xylanimonas protaetiae]